MKRYALFEGMLYYPAGGWDDLTGTYDSLEEAQANRDKYKTNHRNDWYQIVDLQTGVIVDS